MSKKMEAMSAALQGGYPANATIVFVGSNRVGYVPIREIEGPGVVVIEDTDTTTSGYFINSAGERRDISELTGLAVINALKERDEERQRNVAAFTTSIKQALGDWSKPPTNLAKGPKSRNRFARGGR